MEGMRIDWGQESDLFPRHQLCMQLAPHGYLLLGVCRATRLPFECLTVLDSWCLKTRNRPLQAERGETILQEDDSSEKQAL